MKSWKAFELLVKHILINIGFDEVKSDGLYIFNGTAGQMINGLGEAHNADVLLEPPVQIPFSPATRLLIECKNYKDGKDIDEIAIEKFVDSIGNKMAMAVTYTGQMLFLYQEDGDILFNSDVYDIRWSNIKEP